MTLYLHGLGHFHPDNEITNAFLEELEIGTTEQWILERVGIRTRRTVLPLDYIRETRNQNPQASAEAALYNNADIGARAARMAVERAGIDLSDIGMVIAGGSAPDTLTPADACNIAAKLELEVPSFDINSACTSFFVPVRMLLSMDPQALPELILLVTAESMTRTVDYNDRATAVLWGDGAAAAVVSTRVPGRAEFLAPSLDSTPSGYDKVVIPREGFFEQEGQAVHKFAIKRMSERVKTLQRHDGLAARELAFVGHQANLRMLESVCKLCRIPEGRHFHNVQRYGNTAAAGSTSVMSERWKQWKASDAIAVAGVGAGLTWGSYLLAFND